MIEVKNLVKRYDDQLAVDNLSFTLEKGHVLGFLGPNGAGKSTTMNIITGYLQATSGTVKINGHDIEEEPALVKSSIGYLPEMPPLYTDMKVVEYLKFVAELKKVKKADRSKMINEIINLIGLNAVSNRLIAHLSKGYKQRVGLAGAIMGYPDLIILDEPTVGLDPKQVIEIRELIHKLSQKHTIILSSHILSEVSAVCDQVMIINHGKLVVSDSAENLMQGANGGNVLKMKVKADKALVAKTLNVIAGVTNIQFTEKDPEPGITECTITYKNNDEIRDQISFAFADARCPIYEMKTVQSSLEDIFLQVTQNQEPAYSKKHKKSKTRRDYDSVEEAIEGEGIEEDEDLDVTVEEASSDAKGQENADEKEGE